MGCGGAGGDYIKKVCLSKNLIIVLSITISTILLFSIDSTIDSRDIGLYDITPVDQGSEIQKKFVDYYEKVDSIEELKSLEGKIDVLIQNVPGDSNKENFKRELEGNEISYEINYEYDDVFHGYSLEVKGSHLINLFEFNSVKNIYPVGEVIGKTYGAYPHFNVQEARNLSRGFSLKGQGVTVAILDTGVDFYHEDLGNGFGHGNKVVGGADLVNNRDYPIDDEGHGTHIAGIIAADGKKKGLAPEANILAYKVLDEKGKGQSDNVLAALEEIIEDRRNNEEYAADIINMSFGTTQKFVGELISNALETAASEGIVVVTAAGNSGPGKRTLDFPNYSHDVITVGASGKGVNQVDIEATRISGNMTGERMLYSPGVDTGGAKELVYVDNGSYFGDYTDWLGESRVEGKVALAKKGPATYKEKAELARRAGAVALIVFDDTSSEMLYGSLIEPGDHIPTLGIKGSKGRELKEATQNGYVEVKFNNESKIPSFSSRGPSEYNTLKPDLVAPGSRVMSTWVYGNYSWAEGTSVSAAFVSGTAALLRQKNPEYSPDEIKAALMNTAQPLEEGGKDYPLTTQGVGEIRPYAALGSDTVASPGSFSIGHSDYKEGNFNGNRTLTIRNNTSNAKSYQISIEYDNPSSHLDINPGTREMRVAGNDKEEVKIEFNLEENLAFGEYSGYIEVRDNVSRENIEVPFYIIKDLGENLPIIDIDIYPRVISDNIEGEIDLEFTQPLDKLKVTLKNKAGNVKKELYDKKVDKYLADLTLPLEEVSNLSTDVYFVHVSALPRGKSSEVNDNWVESTKRIVVDHDAPEVELIGPNVARESTYELKGRVKDFSLDNFQGEVILEIEGEEVNVDSEGEFKHEVNLSEGENEIEFYLEDWTENSNTISKKVYYKPHGILLFVRGKYVDHEISPILENDRALIPLDVFEDELNSKTRWQEEKDKVEILARGDRIKLFIDDREAIINGKTYKLHVAPRIKEGEVFVPVEVISKGLGFQVKWDPGVEKLNIRKEATKSISDLPFRKEGDMLMNRLLIRLIFSVSHSSGENYRPPGLIVFD